jgi:isopenicillin N synthase-like dioxygenase
MWFDRFNELDGADYTGNIYEVVSEAGDTAVTHNAPYFAERFEVAPNELEEFDEGLEVHAAVLAAADDVARVRVMHAIREGIPLPYYYSSGNRAVFVELTDVRSVVGGQLMRALAESLRWDLRLAYVRRDVYECAFVVS